MTKHSHFPYTITYSSTPHNTNRKHNIHHIHYTIYFHTPRQKKLFLTTAIQTNNPTDPTQSLQQTKNMCHIHTSIVSRHLTTRGNNKILRTPPPHISSSEERLPRLTRRTLAQLRTNKSPFLKSYLHKVAAKSHPSPLCPPATPTHSPHYHPWICEQTPLERWSCWPDGDILTSGPKAG